jgi:hypothetical protein
MLNHRDRVSAGIKSFDIAAQKGKLDKNWRYILNLKMLRISDPFNNPLAQLFGSIHRGLYCTQCMGFAEEHGFLNYTNVHKFPNDATLLKEEWRGQLKTDQTWKKRTYFWSRTIRGITYIIFENAGKYRVASISNLYIFPANYSSVASAKRAVLKHHQKLVNTYSAGVAASQALTLSTPTVS